MEKDITISDIAINAKSKKEIYHVLKVEEGIYLPPINDPNNKYIQNIMRGFKKFLYTKNAKVVKVPHIKGLSIKEIIAWAKDNSDIDSYLPTYSYRKYPGRNWICNVLNTIQSQKFQKLISEALKSREKFIVMKSRLNVVAIPKIISIFSKSQNLSVSKGKSHFLMRDCNVGIKLKNPDEEMKEGINHNKKIDELKTTIKSLEFKIDEYEKNQDELLADRGKLVKLYQEGVIDSDGEYVEH